MRRLLLGLLSCLFFTTHSKPGKILPPQNVSALWVSDFKPGLSWDPPQHSRTDCSYRVSVQTASQPIIKVPKVARSPYELPLLLAMGGRSIQWGVATVCGGSESEEVVLNISYPVLVKKLDCFLYSPHNARCEWTPDRHTPESTVFYELLNECKGGRSGLQCPSYTLTDGVKSGFELEATTCHVIYVLFNATLNNQPVRNTFRIKLKDHVRPPPLNWTVTKSGNKFNISWEPPEIKVPDGWTIQIKYTECGETHEPLGATGEPPYLLPLQPHCQKAIAVRATSEKGETAWSDWKRFGQDEDPKALLYLLAAVPLLMATVVVFICVWFRKNKEKIFPKIPEPVNYLSEFSNNNNDKSVFHNHYIPAKEEASCSISLVVDSQLGVATC